jgi:hypothetical protein
MGWVVTRTEQVMAALERNAPCTSKVIAIDLRLPEKLAAAWCNILQGKGFIKRELGRPAKWHLVERT